MKTHLLSTPTMFQGVVKIARRAALPLALAAVTANGSLHAQTMKASDIPRTPGPMPIAAQQQPKVDAYTKDELLARAQRAGSVPLSSEILERYPNHYTMLVSRHADGQSELHDRYADVLIILEGSGQLTTGGAMHGAKDTAPGEHRGDGIVGGSIISLKTGDIAHIPANVPHQVKVGPNGSITYFVVKVEQTSK